MKKKIMAAIVAFGVLIAPLNTFGKEAESDVTEEVALAILAGLSVELLSHLILESGNNDDNPVSP